jgi:hypothetical protein
MDAYWRGIAFHESFELPPFHIVLSDVQMLLARFAHEESFATYSHGGGPASNLRLVPFMLQMALHFFARHAATLADRLQYVRSVFAFAAEPDAFPVSMAQAQDILILAVLLLPRTAWVQLRAPLLRAVLSKSDMNFELSIWCQSVNQMATVDVAQLPSIPGDDLVYEETRAPLLFFGLVDALATVLHAERGAHKPVSSPPLLTQPRPTVTCPICETAVTTADSQFCVACGYRIPAVAAPAATAAAAGAQTATTPAQVSIPGINLNLSVDDASMSTAVEHLWHCLMHHAEGILVELDQVLVGFQRALQQRSVDAIARALGLQTLLLALHRMPSSSTDAMDASDPAVAASTSSTAASAGAAADASVVPALIQFFTARTLTRPLPKAVLDAIQGAASASTSPEL